MNDNPIGIVDALDLVQMFACGCRVQGALWKSCGRHTTRPIEYPVDEERVREYLATPLWL